MTALAERDRAAATRLSAAPSPTRQSWGTLFLVLTGTFLTTLDFFIVNVAIPSTQRELHAGPAAIQFVVAGFGLALAAGLITSGRLGDRYGRRRLFGIGMAVFTIASVACGLSQNAGELIGARVVQGAAAALLVPQVLAIINTVYTGSRRATAFNAYGLTIGFAAVFGQLIGGALIQADIAGSGWRSIFLVNVPVGIVTLALLRRYVPESRGDRNSGLDLIGMLLVGLGLIAIVLPLVEGRERGWPLWTVICLVASVPLLAGFVGHQHRQTARGRTPLIHLSLFRDRTFAVGLSITASLFLAMGSFFLVLALYLQDGRGMTALGSGLLFTALGAGYFAGTMTAGRLTAKLGKQVIALGAVVFAAGYGLLALAATEGGMTAGFAVLLPGMVVAGVGMGFAIVPLTPMSLTTVNPEHAGVAGGILATMNQTGGAVGIALIGIVFWGALGPGRFTHAFSVSLFALMVAAAATVGLVQLLPHPKPRAADAAKPAV